MKIAIAFVLPVVMLAMSSSLAPDSLCATVPIYHPVQAELPLLLGELGLERRFSMAAL